MVASLDLRPLVAGVTQAQDASTDRGVSHGSSPAISAMPFDVLDQWMQSELTESEPIGEIAEEPSIRERIQIGSLLDQRLRMHDAVTLNIERDGAFYVAWCGELDEYGYGTDPISAVQDARSTIAELYWQLKEDHDRLGSDLAAIWQKLSTLVYEV